VKTTGREYSNGNLVYCIARNSGSKNAKIKGAKIKGSQNSGFYSNQIPEYCGRKKHKVVALNMIKIETAGFF